MSAPAGSSLDHRQAALTALSQSSPKGNQGQRLEAELNVTMAGYVDANRTREAPFRVDRLVAGRTHKRVPTVAEERVASDRALAQVAIADANETIETTARGRDGRPSAVDPFAGVPARPRR